MLKHSCDALALSEVDTLHAYVYFRAASIATRTWAKSVLHTRTRTAYPRARTTTRALYGCVSNAATFLRCRLAVAQTAAAAAVKITIAKLAV